MTLDATNGWRPLQLTSDFALVGADGKILRRALNSSKALNLRRGARAARKAVLFSDNRSGSTGESLSRGQIYLCGFPAPELQVSFLSADGQEDIVDFRWKRKQRQSASTATLAGNDTKRDAEGAGPDEWRMAAGSGSLCRLSARRNPGLRVQPMYNPPVAESLQPFSPKEVG